MNPDPIRHMPEELVPLAEGARRLGIVHDTLRKKLAAGTLRGEKRDGRWYVWVPEPSGMPSGTGPASSGTDPMLGRLESEVAFLRNELESRTEEIRRRDHIIAGLVERVRELPASGNAPVAETVEGRNTPQGANAGPVGDDTDDMGLSTLRGGSWPAVARRWWRRIRGG